MEPEEVFAVYTPEDWGPQAVDDWTSLDALSQELRRRQHDVSLTPTPESSFAAWLRLPGALRRQAWREREIAAQLFEYEQTWMSVPGFQGLGIGIRNIAEARTLVIVVSATGESMDLPNFALGLPDVIKVSSIIPSIGGSEAVPVVVENRPVPTNLQGEEVIESSTCPPDHQPTLRSGLPIAGEDEATLLEPGTLSALVKDASDRHLFLGSAHVCGSRLVRWGERTQDIIGTPNETSDLLDVATIIPSEPNRIDLRLPNLDILPSPPVMPYTGMPVQMFGGASGHQKGYVHESIGFPLTTHRIGFISWIVVDIVAAPGDSGALLVSGHDIQSAIEPAQARYMSRGYFDSMVCSMLGVLRAGPGPNASSTTTPVCYFSPVLQIFDALQIKPETIERREVA
jgi:hypothetical protein